MKKNFILFIAFLTTVIYLTWRGVATLPLDGPLYLLIFGILLWLAEIFATITGGILIWNKQKMSVLLKPKIPTTEYPDIDVFIVTHNEAPALLHKTINAALHMDYPQPEKVHIYLCDDTNRAAMKNLANTFQIHYISMEHNCHAKAGNINHALNLTTSPLVAVFDADMIPYPNFLVETVPFFIENWLTRKNNQQIKPLGLLQTPQSFYNADLFQYNLFTEKSVANEQDFFSREINVLNNAQGAAIYTGSNTVILREAINKVGGFPTDTLTEDFELGARINMAGYQNLSTLFPLASGLTPVDIKSMLKQRIRWGRGVLQSIRNIHLFRTKHLSLGQKLVYFNSYLYWWSFFRRMCFILAPIFYTLWGLTVVDANFWHLLLFWLPCQIGQYFALKEVTSKVSTRRWGEIQETILAPYLVLPILAQFFGLKEMHFKVTDKNAQRSAKDWRYGIPHLILWCLALIGLIRFNLGKTPLELLNGSIISFWLLNHLFNLSFALLFFIGRPSYREHERFQNSYPISLKIKKHYYQFVTVDLSENGLSFKSEQLLYLPTNQLLNFTLTKQKHQLKLAGKIVRIIKADNYWLYGIHLEPMNSEQYNEYLTYIYSGFNQTLPLYYDQSIGLWSRLVNIFRKRIALIKEKFRMPHGSLDIPLGITLMTDYGAVTITRLLDKKLVLQTKQLLFAPQLKLTFEGLTFELTLCHALKQDEFVYTIDNWHTLIHSSQFIKLFRTQKAS